LPGEEFLIDADVDGQEGPGGALRLADADFIGGIGAVASVSAAIAMSRAAERCDARFI